MADKKFTLVAVLKSDIAQFKQGMAEGQKSFKSMTGSIPGLKMLGGAVAAAFAVDKIKDFAIESAKLAGQTQGVKEAFAKIDNGNLLANLKEATRGTVDELTLMQNAVKAEKFRIPLDQLATYFKFATNTAAETGQSVDYLVDSIITGLGRESPLILDNLGISAKALSNKVKEVGNFGQAAGIIIQEMMAKSGEVTLTAAQITEKWKAQLKDAKTEIGTYLVPLIGKMDKSLGDFIPNAVSGFKRIVTGSIELYNEFVDLYNESIAFRATVESIKAVFLTAWEAIKFILKQFGQTLVFLKDLVIAAFSPNMTIAEAWQKFQSELSKNWIEGSQNTAKILAETYNNILNGKATRKDLPTAETGTQPKSSLFSTSETKEQLGLIEQIKGQIEEIEKLIPTAKNTNLLATYNDQKNALQKQLETLQNMSLQISTIDDDTAAMLAEMDAEIIVTPIIDDAPAIKKWQEFNQALSAELEQGIENMIVSISESLGESLVTGDLSDFFTNIAGQLGNFMKQIGALFVSYGVALAVFKDSKNPYAMIIAGAALIALGAAIQYKMQENAKTYATGGIVPGSSFYGDKVPALVNSGEMILNRQQQANLFNMIGAGGAPGSNLVIGGELRLKGGDLVAALDYQRTKRNSM